MRVRINHINLLGTTRSVHFAPGLNVVIGPIGSGKTSLVRLCRSLLGNDFGVLPPEVRRNVSAVSGSLIVGDADFTIVRPLTSTEDAMVDVVGGDLALRLPAQKPRPNSPLTYATWLLDVLNLPRLDVPQAPTKPTSGVTPVTVNDYLMFCTLSQDEIDTSVFGHDHHFKNVKRKYVFQIIYGLYSVDMARLEERHRGLESQIRALQNETVFFERFSKDTPWENRAELEAKFADEQVRLSQLENSAVDVAGEARQSPQVVPLQADLSELEREISTLADRQIAERRAVEQLRRLQSQLETQNQRLTRAIVADVVLVDYDFTICPRCSADVTPARTTGDECYLCLQMPARTVSRDDLINEQQRIDLQISETADLIGVRQDAAGAIEQALARVRAQRDRVASELDYYTGTFVSQRTELIARIAADRAESRERVKRFRDYIELYERFDALTRDIARLEDERDEVRVALGAAESAMTGADEKIGFLEKSMSEILHAFKVVQFGDHPQVRIDRDTLLPVVNGRTFDSISSHGLNVLVNIAHAVAHQRAALKFDLALPNILFIDGLSGNIGHEGLDLERIEAVYEYLRGVSDRAGERLQIIVIDNEVPEAVSSFVRLTLRDDDRLIPVAPVSAEALGDEEAPPSDAADEREP